MPRPGGESDKLGNQFEAVWTVDALLDLFLGRFNAIAVEAFGEESKGVEFHLENLDGSVQFHSVKRQKQGGDWSIADLCRRDKSTGRSVLGDLFEKLESYPQAELRFISATGANELRELSERVTSPESLQEFRTALSPKLLSEFDNRVVALFGGEKEQAFAALKSLRVIPRGHHDLVRTVNRRIEELFYRTDQSPLKADDVRRMLAEFVVDNLGPRVDAQRLREMLADHQIGERNWGRDKSVNDTVAAINRRYLLVTETELINAGQITRDVAGNIVESLADLETRGALLVAPGGFGKSCALAQCLAQIRASGTPVLCLRLDSLDLCSTSRQLGAQLDLPASPAVVLAGIADNTPCVLIVDQLDAISLVSGRNPRMWEVFSELCEEVRSYPKMRMILACRDFDLDHDHRLRRLGESESGFTKHALGRLTEGEIRNALEVAKLSEFSPSHDQLEILAVPFHLLLFLQGDPTRDFNSVGQLYDRYWERKKQNLQTYLGRKPVWNQVIDALTSRMSEKQVLFAPRIVTGEWEDDAKAMVSEHVLVEEQSGRQYRFFHESFFDYAYARRFCASGRTLLDFLTSTEQHLFRRAQVRQILAYRRENDFDQYVIDLGEVLSSPNVRFHIKRMVASGLYQVTKPQIAEWRAIEPLLADSDVSRFLSPALRDHVGWFDLLDSMDVFQGWLASDNAHYNDVAVWYLESRRLSDHRSARIAALIAEYADRESEEWRPRIMRLMAWGQAYKSQEMRTIYLGLVSRGWYDDFGGDGHRRDFWSQHHDAEKECPEFFIDVLGIWFDRMVDAFDDGSSWNFLDSCEQNRSRSGAMIVNKVAAAAPDYYVEQILPRVVRVVLGSEVVNKEDATNRLWPHLSNHGDPFQVDDAMLLCLRRALQHLAAKATDTFRRHAETMSTFPHRVFGYLLLRAWTDNPKEFADECASYLIEDQRRFNIGYSSWSSEAEGSGESAISRKALAAISLYCSDDLLAQMESRIIGYCDEYEKANPRWRGSSELLVLRSLNRSRISKRAKLRIEELERKFPDLSDAIVDEDRSGLVRCVTSPIANETAELMTDSQWISAMIKYDGSTDRFRGGPVELSRSLAEFAAVDRDRFASLVEQMPSEVHARYFSAILDGLSGRRANMSKEERADEKDRVAATETGLFLKVIERLHSLPGRPCGTAIAHCIEQLTDRELPDGVLSIATYYAMEDPDPDPDSWRRYEGGEDDLYQHGINCVRGQAAGAVSSLLYDDPERLGRLRPALISLSKDLAPSVRSCGITAFLPLLNFSPDLAVELFLDACGTSVAICATHPFERFVHCAIQTHYPALRELLQFALLSDDARAVRNAARQTILVELDGVAVGEDGSEIRSGSETMRVAAAEIYASNIANLVVGNICAERLIGFFDDGSEKVREVVCHAFFNMTGERLLELSEFVATFVESPCFEEDPDSVLRALEQSNVELPQIICRAGDRILEFLGEEGTSIAYGGALTARSISTLIVRQYEQTIVDSTKRHCLNLIDKMEAVGYMGIGEELLKIDR